MMMMMLMMISSRQECQFLRNKLTPAHQRFQANTRHTFGFEFYGAKEEARAVAFPKRIALELLMVVMGRC
jgi:hypothetical protein